MNFIHDWLFGGFYMTFEHRVQNLLTYMDAAVRGDGKLMLQTQQRMAKKDAGSEGTPFPVPFPVQGKYHVGQNLSIECPAHSGYYGGFRHIEGL